MSTASSLRKLWKSVCQQPSTRQTRLFHELRRVAGAAGDRSGRRRGNCWDADTLSLAAVGGLAAGLCLMHASPVQCDDAGGNRLYPKDLEQLLKPTESNPTPVTVPPPFPGLAMQQWSQRHVAPILGLPMRGKSHISRELKRYIEFFHGARAEIFDVNQYLGPGGDERLFADLESFFGANGQCADPYSFDQKDRGGDPATKGGFAIILCNDSLESVHSMWSAHTKQHRKWMAKKLESDLQAEVCFIQISVDNAKGDKYIADLAAYRGKTLESSRSTIEEYQDHYVPIQMDGSEKETPFIHLMNYNETMVVNKMMRTFVGSQVCHFLANLHPYQHELYLSRHGESEFNVEKRIGGDSGLSARGTEYARRLAEFAHYVVCGHATNLVCVTLLPDDVKKLRLMLRQDKTQGVVAHGDWTNFGDASGGKVLQGMALKRLQVGYGTEFQNAPASLEEAMKSLGSSGVVTLVFVEGDAASVADVPGRLWTSSLRRTIDTAQFINSKGTTIPGPDGKSFQQMRGCQFRNMDEVYAGEYDGLTEEEIRERAPEVSSARKADKLGFRYPRGESYYDIIARLEPVMSHLERIEQPILLISHQAVLRLMYGWLTHKSREEALDTVVPQHEVVKISFDGLGGLPVETRYPLGPTKLVDDGQGNL
eukprot:gb/GFBE01063688.1/.p1 GENE.gb/GFBE01063688.1/~~gb/GFBE01063688.1/.p1  ORF type:complete len:652 (+),score=139.99 gb/GFBE01063688.1/:1-1956(+)